MYIDSMVHTHTHTHTHNIMIPHECREGENLNTSHLISITVMLAKHSFLDALISTDKHHFNFELSILRTYICLLYHDTQHGCDIQTLVGPMPMTADQYGTHL